MSVIQRFVDSYPGELAVMVVWKSKDGSTMIEQMSLNQEEYRRLAKEYNEIEGEHSK